jgi:NTE family protein
MSPLERRAGSTRPVVAFVFSGGARYAAGQAGMLRALSDAGIRPDLVVGASAGALNAAAFAADPTPEGIDRLVAAWQATKRKDVFPFRPMPMLLGLIGLRDHLVPQSHLKKWLASHIELEGLQDAPVPLHVVATDRASGSAVVLSSGPAIPALLASSAIPGIFGPITIGGRMLVDGGIASDTPVSEAVALGATKVFVLPSHAASAVPARGGAFAHMTYAYSQVFGHWTNDQAEATYGADVEVLPLPPLDHRGPLDFSGTSALIVSAERLTRSWFSDRTDRATAGRSLREVGPVARLDVGFDARKPTPSGGAGTLRTRQFTLPEHLTPGSNMKQ